MAKRNNTTTHNIADGEVMDYITIDEHKADMAFVDGADDNTPAIMDNETHTADPFDDTGISPDYELAFHGFKVTFGALPLTSRKYLLQYGFAQCLQDMSMAQIRTQAERKGLTMSDAEVADALEARRGEKVRNLLNGTLFAKRVSAPRADSFTKAIKAVVLERITAACIKKGRKVPAQNSDIYAKLANDYLAKYGDDVRAEAQKRIDSALDIDVDDLFDVLDA